MDYRIQKSCAHILTHQPARITREKYSFTVFDKNFESVKFKIAQALFDNHHC